MVNFECKSCDEINFNEIIEDEVEKIREMRKLYAVHLSESPCFMRYGINLAEKRNSRVFAAFQINKPIAYLEVMDNGEHFATEVNSMKSICGAFCLPEYRGKGIFQGLLNYTITKLKAEGFKSLGVDFEGFNPTASGFWLKYFTIYTNSVVRRIDECAFLNV
jgi:GNAT superfamily N-acetyltransferase